MELGGGDSEAAAGENEPVIGGRFVLSPLMMVLVLLVLVLLLCHRFHGNNNVYFALFA